MRRRETSSVTARDTPVDASIPPLPAAPFMPRRACTPARPGAQHVSAFGLVLQDLPQLSLGCFPRQEEVKRLRSDCELMSARPAYKGFSQAPRGARLGFCAPSPSARRPFWGEVKGRAWLAWLQPQLCLQTRPFAVWSCHNKIRSTRVLLVGARAARRHGEGREGGGIRPGLLTVPLASCAERKDNTLRDIFVTGAQGPSAPPSPKRVGRAADCPRFPAAPGRHLASLARTRRLNGASPRWLKPWGSDSFHGERAGGWQRQLRSDQGGHRPGSV